MQRSRDAGRSFDDPVYVVPNNLHNLPEMSALLDDGTLVVSYTDASWFTADSAGRRVENDFTRRRAWVITSTDGGSTFSAPSFVTDACGPPPAYSLSAFAADHSNGQFRNRLYFACREAGRGSIVVTHSADRGETWSVPTRVNAPDTLVGRGVPALAVNDRGEVMVAWIDNPPAARRCEQRLFASVSRDGGKSFAPMQLVSSVPPCAESTFVGHPTGGDYFGLSAVPGGEFRVLWSEMRESRAEIRFVAVTVVR